MKPNATRFRPSVSPNATMQGGKTEEVLVKGSKDLLIWRNNPASLWKPYHHSGLQASRSWSRSAQ